MYIKNITNEEIIIAGLSFDAEEKRLLTEIGSSDEIQRYAEEILEYFNDSKIEVLYADESKLTSAYRLLRLLSGDSNEVSITNISEINEIVKSPEDNKTNDYYYNNYDLIMEKGRTVDIEFKGYLKTALLRIFSGKLSAQIISEPMNKVIVEEQNLFEIDTDNKLLNPIIRLEALSTTTASFFTDGSYFDETGKKTKEQYLNEIYNKDVSLGLVVEEDKIMNFNIDFRKQNLISGNVLESINNYSGTAQGFSEDNETVWNRETNVTFNTALGVCKEEEFTQSAFFKPSKGAHYVQYFMLNGQVKYQIYSSGRMHVWVLGRTAYAGFVTYDSWNHIAVTYNKEKINIYLNSVFVCSLPKPAKNYNLTKLSIGNYSLNYRKKGFIGEIGRISAYNYSFSAGMIYHLYKVNHPNNEKYTNTINFVNTKYFDLSSLKETEILNKYQFDILEKEYRNPENILSKEHNTKIDFTSSDFYKADLDKYFVINEGYFTTLEDSYHSFKIENNQYGILTIDDRDVCLSFENNGEGSIYLPEGRHTLKYIAVSFEDNSYFYCKKYDEENQDWIFFNLDQNDIEDEESSEEDKTKLIKIKDGNFTLIKGELDNSSNAELIDYDTYKMLNYKGDKFTYIKNLSDIMSSNVFSISLILKMNSDRECYIFSMGGDEQEWQIWLSLRYYNKRLELSFNDKNVKSNKIKINTFYQIDIVSDGTNIELILNAKENNKNILIDDNNWFEGSNLYFNRLPNRNTYRWMQSNYSLDSFNYYSITKSKKDLENSFAENTKIYDFSYINTRRT